MRWIKTYNPSVYGIAKGRNKGATNCRRLKYLLLRGEQEGIKKRANSPVKEESRLEPRRSSNSIGEKGHPTGGRLGHE